MINNTIFDRCSSCRLIERLTTALICAVVVDASCSRDVIAHAQTVRSLAEPVTEGLWIRPDKQRPAEPRWGFADGLQVGIHPLGGPRGLLRIYAPYLDHPRDRLINFIAVEPIVAGEDTRGLSELEHSKLDDAHGKRFWSADSLEDNSPQQSDQPARGVIETIDGVEQLAVYILVERFESGAHVYLQLRFRADRPHEVGIATFAHKDSAPLDYCIITATMGNFARLRQLHLAKRIVTPAKLWPDYKGDHFTPHARFPLDQLRRTDAGEVVVEATTDEADPIATEYHPATNRHWKYDGKKAVQSWRASAPAEQLEALANGRYVYWASRAPIPGGVSFENFELKEPFQQGREFIFAVDPESD